MICSRRTERVAEEPVVMLRELHRNIKLRIGIGVVQRFFSVMLMPLMVIHLATLYGAATAGILTLVIAAAGVCSNFLGGHLADTRGRRPVMLAGEIGATGALALLALANAPWWQSGPVTFGLFLLYICSSAMAMPAAEAMVVDVSTPENRKLVYTINYWSINAAFAFGALVGGFLYRDHFVLLLTAAATLFAGTSMVIWRWITETAPEFAKGAATGIAGLLRGYVAVVRDRIFLRLWIAAMLIQAIEVQIIYYIAVRLAGEFPVQTLARIGPLALEVGGVEMFSILRAMNPALVVVLALAAGSLYRRLSDRTRLYAGIAVFTGGYMVWAVSNTGWVLVSAAVVLTLGEIANVPIQQALLADLVDPRARPRYLAAYGLRVRVGPLIGALCVIIGTALSPVGMSLLYGAFGITAILLYRSLLRARDIQHGGEPAGPGSRDQR